MMALIKSMRRRMQLLWRSKRKPLEDAALKRGVVYSLPCNYVSKNGAIKTFDFDAVFDLVGGYSRLRAGWPAMIIFAPRTNAFVEIRSSPPDHGGDGTDEVQEIDEAYIQETFGLSAQQIAAFKTSPNTWRCPVNTVMSSRWQE